MRGDIWRWQNETVKPLTVRITTKTTPLVAERRYEVTCESAGSRPPAVITWYKGKRQLRRVKKSWKSRNTRIERELQPLLIRISLKESTLINELSEERVGIRGMGGTVNGPVFYERREEAQSRPRSEGTSRINGSLESIFIQAETVRKSEKERS
ncbi:hypothetical protein J437_LFUL002790 [Ladona fulva]|uniref:CD80-like immunoglobulin C2-set domain-containing protein n=1 Tax=Ladona fulva TaxID=123851 RepID=A0A8K0JXH6_LADFU|nr:hypothetical protein J437_LFUL002790 [Ladona fulva]